MSQFGYCPLIWINHNGSLNNNINRIHERTFRIVCSDKKSTFKELLKKDNSVTVHVKNLQVPYRGKKSRGKVTKFFASD